MNDNDILFFDDDISAALSALDAFGLLLRGLYISFPEPKTQYIELPFSNEIIDLTEVDGTVYYSQREITLEFDYLGDFPSWHSNISYLADCIHGKRKKIVDTTDAGYYYFGRLSVDTTKTDPVMAQVVLTGQVGPFKHELQSSLDDWLWDTLDFNTGVIREYRDLMVNGQLSLTVPGTGMIVIPVITSSAAMKVTFEGQAYDLRAGTNKIYGIRLKPHVENVLKFAGNGRVSVDYRGGWL